MVLQRYRAKQVSTSLAFCMSASRLRSARPARPARWAEDGVPHNRVQELGKGSFGTVYLTEGRRDKKPYVVKVRGDGQHAARQHAGERDALTHWGKHSDRACACAGARLWTTCGKITSKFRKFGS
jgi:hypothetical protein